MIKTHSDDPDVEAAAQAAAQIVERELAALPKAERFDYGGHTLELGEYGVCTRCTTPIAEAQQAQRRLLKAVDHIEDPLIREHVALAAELFRLEAVAAEIRAELHNGRGSEKILNQILGFLYDRSINDSYDHSHHKGE